MLHAIDHESPGRFSIASICASRCRLRLSNKSDTLATTSQARDSENESLQCARQVDRYANVEGVLCNAQATASACRALIRPRREAESLLRRAISRWNLSVRAYERTLAVARFIADLDAASDIDVHHVAEALQYRLQQDRS